MKKILLTAAIAAAALTALPVAAKTVTYTDKNVSFEYDNQMYGVISYITPRILYFAPDGYGEEGYCTVGYNTIDPEYDSAWEDMISLPANDKFDININDELKEMSFVYHDTAEGTTKYKILGERADTYITVSIHYVSEGTDCYQICKAFYDSATVMADFSADGFEMQDIYRRDRYSEQAIIYAEKVIEILDSYLKMTISGKDAAKQVEDISKRFESYLEVTDCNADEQLQFEISLTALSLSMGSDASVIKHRADIETRLYGPDVDIK